MALASRNNSMHTVNLTFHNVELVVTQKRDGLVITNTINPFSEGFLDVGKIYHLKKYLDSYKGPMEISMERGYLINDLIMFIIAGHSGVNQVSSDLIQVKNTTLMITPNAVWNCGKDGVHYKKQKEQQQKLKSSNDFMVLFE